MEFKDNLYRIRKEKGMSQEELAALCDVSRQAISKWETGTANPDMVSIDELLGNKIPLEKEVVKEKEVIYVHNRYTYEKRYRSKLSICGIPLVDINVGRGRTEEGYWRVAKGIIAIGNVSVGVISIGLLSVGLCSLGLLTLGLRLLSVYTVSVRFPSGLNLPSALLHMVRLRWGQIRLGISYTICAPPIPAFWIRRNTCSFRNTCPENHCRKSLNSLYR